MHAQPPQSQHQWGLPVRQNTVDAMLDDLQIPDIRMDLNIPDDSFDFQGYPGLAAPMHRGASLRDSFRAGSLGGLGMSTGMSTDLDAIANQPSQAYLPGISSPDLGYGQPPNMRLVTTGNAYQQSSGLQMPFPSQLSAQMPEGLPGLASLPSMPALPDLPPVTSQLYPTPFADPQAPYESLLNMPSGMPALSDDSSSGPHDDGFPSSGDHDSHLDSHPGSRHDRHQASSFGLGGPHQDTKTKRNAKQQMQNKQAQQRYRERRKQRFNEMEQQVKVLTNQLQDQASLRRQNNALMARVQELEHAIRLHKSALDQAQEQLKARGLPAQSKPADREESNDSELNGEGEFDTYLMRPGTSINRAEQLVISMGRQQAKEAQLRGFADVFTQRYKMLKDFIDTHNLRDVNPADVNSTSKELQRELLHLVNSGSRACIAAEQTSGIKVLDLMTRNLRELTQMTCQDERKKWMSILQALKMTQQQSETIMEMRKVLLVKLGTVYDERRQLHLQTMALMGSMASCGSSKMTCLQLLEAAPQETVGGQAQGTKAEPDTEESVEQRIGAMSLTGYNHCARNDVSLDQMLDKIKDNLRLEQRIICELNATIIHRVFTPMQAALFLVEIYPAYTDTLSLANIVEWLRFGRSGSAQDASKLDGIPTKEDKSDASDQCSLDRTDS